MSEMSLMSAVQLEIKKQDDYWYAEHGWCGNDRKKVSYRGQAREILDEIADLIETSPQLEQLIFGIGKSTVINARGVQKIAADHFRRLGR